MPLPIQQGLFQAAAEPMQVDAAPEENDNVEDDLEQYASQYTGLAKLNRLKFIADHCPPLRLDALRMALQYVMTTYNTNLYQQIYRKLQEALSSNSSLPDAVVGAVSNVTPLDAQWIETTSKKAALKLEKRGHDDLGDHYLDCGDLSNALKCYSRARDYCTSPKHVVNMCLNVIKHGKDGGQTILTKLRCAAGLADLATKKYKSAAKYFLLASFDHCDFPELFLELEPQLRDIIHKFNESNYASCLHLLDELKDNLYLDLYLVPHVNTLYSQIRNRALCQYFSPYLSADMGKMAASFNTSVLALEDELMQLILDGQIKARIDSHSKILYAKDTDQRSTTFEKSLQMGQEYQRRTKALVLRSAVLKNQISVKCPPREGGQGGEMSIAPGNASSARN
ncbi:CSN1-like protein [Mya arenaria]|uniref:CSN1-like protein n=1 Tax=Mya arenaria TaxID=6604 RepID=A0ABY7DFJ6_MYAAR|nr:CSN1-like protein [Mya arenaria]